MNAARAVSPREHQRGDPGDASPLSVQQNNPLPDLTTVNGIGMWNQWTRNFTTPLLALLDLMDNALDAASQPPTETDYAAQISVFADHDSYGTVTGLCLLNNTPNPIKPMAQILEVYQSSKGSASQSIGENGVGLKQGCATLSDLSFCLSKSLNQYSLGIVSKSLQRKEGCALPSYSFTSLPTRQELFELFTTQPMEGTCITAYGDGSLRAGVHRVLSRFKSFSQLHDDDHVFCVVLHQLKHGKTQEEEEHEVNYAQNAMGLMKKLKQEMPRQYIHVPSALDVRVNGEQIAFAYWQRRLIELSVFELKIDSKHPVMKAYDWLQPATDGYTLRVYAGFDPIRLEDESKSPLSLFVYSRQAGRLITHSQDARALLGLNASGTTYSQGLTILVDDFHGKLPLNPTKQDLAFGEEANGEVHRANLFAWLSAVTRMYYNFHLAKFPNKQKALLTAEVKRHLPTVRYFHQPDFSAKPLPECDFTTFKDIGWRRINGAIQVRSSQYRHVNGADTRVKITAPPPEEDQVLPAAALPVLQLQQPDVGASRKGKRKRTVEEIQNDDEEESVSDTGAPSLAFEDGPSTRSESPQSVQDDDDLQNVSMIDESAARIEDLERDNRALRSDLEIERKKRKDQTAQHDSALRHEQDEHRRTEKGLRNQIETLQNRMSQTRHGAVLEGINAPADDSHREGQFEKRWKSKVQETMNQRKVIESLKEQLHEQKKSLKAAGVQSSIADEAAQESNEIRAETCREKANREFLEKECKRMEEENKQALKEMDDLRSEIQSQREALECSTAAEQDLKDQIKELEQQKLSDQEKSDIYEKNEATKRAEALQEALDRNSETYKLEIDRLNEALKDAAARESSEGQELKETIQSLEQEYERMREEKKQEDDEVAGLKEALERSGEKEKTSSREIERLNEELNRSERDVAEKEKASNDEIERLNQTVIQREHDVARLRRELAIQEDFCRTLRSQLAEQDAPTLL